VSEYQYYDFVALERPLTPKEMAELRKVSSRAEITPTRLWSEYHYGDFRGSSAKLMARYFDAHLYFSNWGARRLMLRMPSKLVSLKSLRPYFGTDAARASRTGQQVTVDLHSREEESDYLDEADSALLASLTPLRAELMCGDLRVAYLAWLLALQAGDVADEAIEPPLPVGLSELTSAQQAMVDFFRLDPDLLAAAAAVSPALTDDSAAARRWVAELAPRAKEQWLKRALERPDLRLGAELLAAFRRQARAPLSRPGRSAGTLLATAEESRGRRRGRARRAAS